MVYSKRPKHLFSFLYITDVHLIFLLELLQSPGSTDTLVLADFPSFRNVHNYTMRCFLFSFRPDFKQSPLPNPSDLALVQMNTVQSQPSLSKHFFRQINCSVSFLKITLLLNNFRSMTSIQSSIEKRPQHKSAMTSQHGDQNFFFGSKRK